MDDRRRDGYVALINMKKGMGSERRAATLGGYLVMAAPKVSIQSG